MWIVITTPFIDKQAEDPKDAEVPAGKKMNVTAERGQELIDLGLAEASDTDAAKGTKTAPEPARNNAALLGSDPIASGNAGPVDGHLVAEETPND